VEDAKFIDVVEEIFMQLEDELDEFDEDIDIDTSGGLLTVTFPANSTIVLSKQIAQHEIWIAAVSGGFHLSLRQNGWFCETTDETLGALLSRVFTEQLGRSVTLLSSA